MGITKLIDEAAEEASGYQRQTKEQQYKDAIFEGALGFAGEGVGRAISGLFGRIIKGGGAGPEAELARQQGRALRQQGFKPLFEGAAPGVRPILNRIQAVAEGVFPYLSILFNTWSSLSPKFFCTILLILIFA